MDSMAILILQLYLRNVTRFWLMYQNIIKEVEKNGTIVNI